MLEGFVEAVIDGDDELQALWDATKALNASVEVYCG